ncbi:polysaccharide pyruvyl transferase family protein [Rothia nasimurium]|uniref:polysaccharide pyruvyl transferase family protein n=1 Tax=Rothia nasimurium TaxID=85336 RepID=UPI0036133AB4
MPRILVLADLGQSVYHVGDEAMGIATAAELTRRGYEVYIATRSVEHSQAYIGTATGYIKTLDFPVPPAEREIFLGQVRQHLGGHPAAENITTFVRQVADMDGIVIAGGGNMNSATGHLLYERAAYALVAQAHEIPLVISGQSVGPVLTDADAETLRDMLSSAQLVGMRERFSQAWARNAAIDSHLIVDDATFYQHQKRSLPGRPVVDLPEHYICATFSGLAPGQARVIGQLLDDMHREYGLRTVFLPHMGEPLTDQGDVAVHAEIASHMFSNPVQLPMVHADDAVQVHRGAFIAVSTRYHPGVFSLSAGVPFVALLPDAFTDMRVRGMMEQYGAENYAIPLALLNSDAPAEALHEVIQLRNELSETLLARAEQLRGFSASWWDAASHVLLHGAEQAAPAVRELGNTPTIFTGEWNITNLLVRDDIAEISLAAARASAETDRALSWDYQRLLQRDRAQARADELERRNAELADSLIEAEENATLRGWMRRKMRGE